MHLSWIDYLIIALYCAFVLGVGFKLKKSMRTSLDFFLSGRKIPAWITGLAFISANLGALEVMGMAASGAEYGMLTCHFYWLGAIPAMLFVGLAMMPFYYGSRARSVPEYLRLRFDEKTRGLNAITFAVMTVLASGINLYAMALLFKLILGWSIHATILLSAIVVLIYTFLGGLTSSIYNEVLQFFLIVFGILPLAVLSVVEAGGWHGMAARLPAGFMNMWTNLGHASSNPMGVDWFQMVAGLGFVLSFGYWCTDFLVVQRALAAQDMNAAQRTPLIAAVPKMFIPFLVIIPGMAAWAILPHASFMVHGRIDYNMALPLLLARYYPAGMLGVGITALLASFMSGMAGNVTAFNTVWTYDIYHSYIKPGQSDEHYLWMGKVATVGGVLISILAAYVALQFGNIMDYLQLIFSFVNAPLFATFLLGMFWKRTTPSGAFWGLLAGSVAAGLHYFATVHGWISYRSVMAGNFDRAIFAWTTCFVLTILITLFTRPRAESELHGLVYSLTEKPTYKHLGVLKRPATLAIAVIVIAVALDWVFR
ncbi:MAG TPA: sodium:solute symporter family protein [Candidatus Acidoferrales bacterium]|nr:sodium:solute symporter family protein [Candidatus Acidoferrales bacterium]